MIGSAIGAGVGTAASIFGGVMATKAMNKVKKNLESQQRENQAWFEQKYNEDATQRADAVRALQKTEESIRNRNKEAAASAAVMGGTEESMANARAANNEALASAVSNIAASADARKDAIEQQYMAKKDNLAGQLNSLEQQKAAAIGEAAKGVASAANSFGDSLDALKGGGK